MKVKKEMGIRDSMNQVQAEQRAAEQARQNRMKKDIPQDWAQVIAQDLYNEIREKFMGMAKSRRFKYYNGMFGRKTNCRYVCQLAYRVELTDTVNCFGQPFSRPNEYIGCRLNDPSDYDGYDRILCGDPVIPQKVFRIVCAMLAREGIRANFSYSAPVLSFEAELPCDANGNVK